jgi:hypothetical protein
MDFRGIFNPVILEAPFNEPMVRVAIGFMEELVSDTLPQRYKTGLDRVSVVMRTQN